jgi:hypothetical protein
MELTVTHTWTVSLSQQELLLILKALGGRLKDEEKTEAAALGEALTRMRAARVKSVGDWANKLETSLDGKKEEPKT